MYFQRLAVYSTMAILAACAGKEDAPPDAEQRPERLELHGDVRFDNYFWLRDRDDPEVIAYLEAENAYTERMLEPMDGLQQTLIGEMKSRIKPDEESVPYR
jgi:oligopeptidase B